jgi:RecA/RadA recombinase
MFYFTTTKRTIIKLEKTGVGKRQATIIKHRSLAEGGKAEFRITSKGIE